MDNFLNNEQNFEINCRSSYISYINTHLEKKCWFENCIFNYFFLEIYRDETDYFHAYEIRVITKLPNSEQSYKGKVKTHKYINRQNRKTDLVQAFLKKWLVESH
jgi:hypothetical protein